MVCSVLQGSVSMDRTTFDAPIDGEGDEGARAYIAVASGPGEPTVVNLRSGADMAIGRSRSSALCVDDGAVSRTHATLRWDGGGTVQLTDHGSRNGTLVDGRRVRGTVVLGSGAELQVGSAKIVVVVGGPPAVRSNDMPANPSFVVRDPEMLRVLALADRAARSDATILLVGSTGVGKELVARHVHDVSPRRDGRFVAVNCGAIPETVAESTLFGHEKGAFTDAVDQRPGVFEAADGGTLFLDEIGELSSASQARLLRTLSEGTVNRVGGHEPIDVDVRLVAATNRDLDTAVERDLFRKDLLYRLDVIRITIPGLRERREDILPLARHFLADLAVERTIQLAPDAIAQLMAHDWPGNVRQLRNVIERAIAVSQNGLIRASDLELEKAKNKSVLDQHVDDVERRAIVAALEACSNNKTQAAKRLGISRRALLYRMEKLGLKALPPSQRS